MSQSNVGASPGSTTDPGYMSRSPAADYTEQPTGWTGWIVFAGVMMVMLGCFHAIAGLVGILKDDYYLVGSNDLVVQVDYTTWGWVHLIAGIVVAIAGGALVAGQMWARVVAILVAFLSALMNIAFLSAYPIWSTIMIVLDVVVIWAVTVHGHEMKDMDRLY